MKKKKYLLVLVFIFVTGMLSACNSGTKENTNTYKTPDDYEPVYYLSEEELPNDMYYIVHTETQTQVKKDGTETEIEITKYYPVYSNVEHNYDQTYDYHAGFNSNRIMWVNYNLDEGLIPTMYPGDKLIYKSATYIPTTYSLEKFFDNGYTLGVCGLVQDLSSNYRYYSANKGSGNLGYAMTTSDAIGFEGLEAESIYLVALGEDTEIVDGVKADVEYKRVSPADISLSGTVSGLELMKKYACDIRTGTEKIAAILTCNVHYFSSAENYMFGSFSFITEHIAELHIPDYVTTGYYNMNGAGMFRYLKDETEYKSLQASDYNKTIYTYDDSGHVDGTTIGLVFDANSFLVESGLIDNFESSNETGNTYDKYIESQISSITNKTLLKADDSGCYSGSYEYLVVSEPIISDKDKIYDIKAMNTENFEVIKFRFTQKADKDAPEEGTVYSVVFMQPDDTYNGYDIVTMTSVSVVTENDNATENDDISADIPETK